MHTSSDANHRFLLPLSAIKEGERLRKDYGDVTELAESIRELGLLQPIVVSLDGTLIAGGRRLRAMRDVLKWTEFPVTYFEVADEVTLRMLEVEENVRRKQMTWQERVTAVAVIHERQALSKALKSEKWTQSMTGELLGQSTANVSYALQLAGYIRQGDKEILKCLTMWDAIHLIVKRGADESNRLLAKMTVPSVDPSAARKLLDADLESDSSDIFSKPTSPASGGVSTLVDDGEMPGQFNLQPHETITIALSQMCVHGDALEVLPHIPENGIDHVITDWPFGIDMDNIQQPGGGQDVSTTSAEHVVEDNIKLHTTVIPMLYRVLKPGGFFITFIDITQWQTTYDQCLSAGFAVQRWPLIWHKTHRCQNLMASYNFTKDYEIAIVCRKGNATLLTPQASSVHTSGTADDTRALGHPFAKPPQLWRWIFSAVAHQGQLVLDPFAGCGSSTLAAIQHGLQPLAVEKTERHHAQMVVNIAEYYRKTLKDVKFT